MKKYLIFPLLAVSLFSPVLWANPSPPQSSPSSVEPVSSSEKPVTPVSKNNLSVSDLPVVQLTNRYQSTSLEKPTETQYFSKPLITDDILHDIKHDSNFYNNILSSTHLLLSNEIAFASSVERENLSHDVAIEFLRLLDPSYVFFTKKEIDHLSAQKKSIELAMTGEDLSWITNSFDHYQKKVQSKLLEVENDLASETKKSYPDVFIIPQQWDNNPHRFSSFGENQILGIMSIQGVPRPQAQQIWLKTFRKMASQSNNIKTDTLVEFFLRAYASACDPHSLYLSPAQKNIFQKDIHKVFDGLGFSWALTPDGRVVVENVIDGSSAFSSGLKTQDEIVSILTDEGEIFLKGKSKNEVYHLLQMPSNQFKFQIKRNTTIETISIMVRKTPITTSLAQAKVFEINNKNILVLKAPSFYQDPLSPQRKGGSLTRDLSELLEQHRKEKHIFMVVLDLRGNPGGVLSEASSLLGLFLDGGVALQVRTPHTPVRKIDIPSKSVLWKGALTVLIDSKSASASEIVASALQDYKRALIVGQQTYGKGSAQTLFDFDALSKLPISLFGQVNLTTLMFYRPNGQTVQLNGVVPDIPLLPEASSVGEKSFRHILENKFSAESVVSHQSMYWEKNIPLVRSDIKNLLQSKKWYSFWIEDLAPPSSTVILNESKRLKNTLNLTIKEQEFKSLLIKEKQDHPEMGDDVLLFYALSASERVFSK